MDIDFKVLSTKHKNNKVVYYFLGFSRLLIPSCFNRIKLQRKLNSLLKLYDLQYIKDRVNYYNRIKPGSTLSQRIPQLKDFKLLKRYKTYFFDTFEYSRYFSPDFRMHYVFGDLINVPDEPAIVKSRPIEGDNSNSVLMKLNKVRHFTFVRDNRRFSQKKDMLVGRMNAGQPHRNKFLELYINHPMCNVGKINMRNEAQHLLRGMLTMDEQLEYKFILCLEGNDVATSLKWVMSSQSLAVSPKLKYETWFMEGKLIPNYHFMLIKDDFSDLEERMNYYIEHPDEAQLIINNANQYVKQFQDKMREELISLLVLEKYFCNTGQKESFNLSLVMK